MLAHVVSLMSDPYAQLRASSTRSCRSWAATARPGWGSARWPSDLLGVVTVVSLARHRVGPRLFRAVHYATYLPWPVALAQPGHRHGRRPG
ncbi:MAG: hypothetical protein R2734_13110 [Nocardioides sp.]